ncbi:hypothetical protein [Pseudomonas synxantha]|uniref:hypothetical protein n=1 Tax=Pseudomonas synxantha TaxID=47883 RepID=UPI000F56C0AE|nr:hypothetical protein [Pseudomonas synxantha]AZE65634.1 hypothetical protein C4K01_1422 [Pseudomonas synxantha]
MTTKNNPDETHEQRLQRLRGALEKLKKRFEDMPPGRGAGMPAEIRAMEARIKREEMHLLSGYYEQKGGPVRGGSPGSGRRS